MYIYEIHIKKNEKKLEIFDIVDNKKKYIDNPLK